MENENTPNSGTTDLVSPSKGKRGFGSMSPEKQREIASKGGRAAHMKGTAHEWTTETARAAGRKGGQISRGGRGRLIDGSSEQLREEHNANVISEISSLKE